MAEQLPPRWSKANVLIGALGGIALPATLAIVGYWYGHQQEIENQRRLQADRVERMLSHLTSENARQRLLAIRVTRFLAEQEQLPPELLDVLIATAQSDPEWKVSTEAVEALGSIADGGVPEYQRNAAREALKELPERVYLRIADEQQRPEAEELAARLSAQGFIVPDIKNVGAGPSQMQVWYFNEARSEEARRLAALTGRARLSGVGERRMAAPLNLSSEGKGSPARPTEIWFPATR